MKKFNKKGEFVIGLVFLGLISAIGIRATVETAQSGVLKKNGQKIWCKMQNKGSDYCDAQYQ